MEKTTNPNHPSNALFSHCVTRRRLLACVAGFLVYSSVSEIAHATQYATSDMRNVYSKPNITQLSQNSNLFYPADRPRSTIVATCTMMNPDSFGQGSAAYWGADQGLGFVSADQKDWPYRNHAYGIDVFDRYEFESNHYTEYLTDSLSGAALSTNANEASRDGFRNHHIVSFGAWDISDFGGGVIPNSIGCWSVHNHAGYIWGHYGEYRCTGNEGGERPPDDHCCPLGIATRVYITVFSVTPETNGADYLLRYCLYVFIDMHAIASDRDDYAGIAWTSTPAAALGCKVSLEGFDTLGIQFAKNLYRCMMLKEISSSMVSQVKSLMRKPESTLYDICELVLRPIKYQTTLDTEENAIRALYYSMSNALPNASTINKWASYLKINGLCETAKKILENLYNSRSIQYPVEIPSYKCDINERDCLGTERIISCDKSGKGNTAKVFNRGNYSAWLYGNKSGWNVKSTFASREIPDWGSDKQFDFEFTASATQAPEVIPLIKVSYYHDYINFTKCGLNPYLTSDLALYGKEYQPLSASKIGAVQQDAKWTGWCIDETCNTQYIPRVLTENLKLYCKNSFDVIWRLSNRASQLERDIGTKFSTKNDMSVQTNLTALLPSNTTLDWKDTYLLPKLSDVWWESGHDIRHSAGLICKDAKSTQSINQSRYSSITINGKTLLYADWKPQTYDGIQSQ